MNIALVVYSATGNTRKAANQLKNELETKGNAVEYLEIKPLCDPKESVNMNFDRLFDLSLYDMLIFGSFVEAFTLNKCMKEYIKKMPRIDGKKAVMLTTQRFPKKWMGGRQALNKMKSLLEEKGAQVLGGEDINWKNKEDGRQERIDFAIGKIAEMI
jgi:flavodoxin